MNAILIIDHGSKVKEANDMLFDVAVLLRDLAKNTIIEVAHMELANPTIAEGFEACVKLGATHVIAVPYMLSPGRHSTSDIPSLVKQAAKNFSNISFTVSEPLGVHQKICEVVIERAKLKR